MPLLSSSLFCISWTDTAMFSERREVAWNNSVVLSTDEECVPSGPEVLGASAAHRRHDNLRCLRRGGAGAHCVRRNEEVSVGRADSVLAGRVLQ